MEWNIIKLLGFPVILSHFAIFMRVRSHRRKANILIFR